jgi:hypothetical protein
MVGLDAEEERYRGTGSESNFFSRNLQLGNDRQ